MNENIFAKYLAAFDELNVLMLVSMKNAQSVQDVIEDTLSILINAYKDGVKAAESMLSTSLDVDVAAMRDAIYKVTDGKTFEDRITEYVGLGNYTGVQRVVETEYHRVYTTGELDGATQYRDSTDGVLKSWHTVGDNKVRETHRHLEGVKIALDEEFFTIDGDHAPAPGQFEKAENNVSCRCVLVFEPDMTA